MARKKTNRWGYMSDPRYNPANNDCPECSAPSKTYHQGSKTVDGTKSTRWRCEAGHTWTLTEERPEPPPRP